MSSVSSSSGSSGTESSLTNTYQSALREMQDRLDAETKRNKEMREEQAHRLEQAHRNELNRKEQESDEVIRSMRDETAQAIVQQNTRHQDEVERLKNQIYNARGEISGTIPVTAHEKEVQDIRSEEETRHRVQRENHDREDRNLFHDFGSAIDRQQREFDRRLEDQKADAEERIAALRQENQFNLNADHRAFNARQNELTREYEQKLANQRREYEAIIEDLKAQAHADLRSLEQRSQVELELQAKDHENQIARLEAQSQERERTIAQSYSDELDRTRRSYELSIKKKS